MKRGGLFTTTLKYPSAVAAVLLFVWPRAAWAGMPSLTLTDIAQMRLQTMSFFLLVLLGSALVIKLIWNALRNDFARLPWLSYPKAVGFVALWGLLFILVLTMISGARELMTPGAWEKDGYTYKISSATPADRDVVKRSYAAREGRLVALRDALWAHAAQHDGELPADADAAEIDPSLWETSEPSRARFIYTGGRTVGQGMELIAHEPPVFDGESFALFSDGSIVRLSRAELRDMRKTPEAP